MFAITTPQTVTLTIPGDDGPSTLINFRTDGDDTSRCVLEIVTPEGDTHRLTFSTRGTLVDSQFVDHDSAPEAPVRPDPQLDEPETPVYDTPNRGLADGDLNTDPQSDPGKVNTSKTLQGA
jgi:hypothetical protein